MPGKDISHVKNVGFVLYGIDDARMEPYPLPKPLKPDEVLLRSLSCGICGTDIHYWKEMALGSIKITEPFILGHEASGEVVGVGSDVKHLKIGDRICTEPLPVCLKCEHCKRLDFNLCVEGQHPTPPFNGALTYYYNHPAEFCFKVPDTISNEEAAMIEPLCVSVHACRRVGVTVGSTVFITGSGPIGILNMLVARAYGASRVVLTDIKAERLKLAKELGADETILVSRDWSEDELLARVKKAFNGDWPTISMESSGVASNFRIVLLATKAKGNVMLVGMGPTEILLPIAEASNKEITIHGCFRYANCWDLAIELAPKLPLAKLISHRFDLKDSQKAFETAYSGSGMKIMIKIDD